MWNSSVDGLGMIFALIAAASYTIYFLIGERALKGMNVVAMTFWSMLFASVFWAFFSGWQEMDFSMFSKSISLTGSLAAVYVPLWAPLLWILTMGSFVAFYMSFKSLSLLPATSAGIVASSEVIFAFIVAWLWLGESLTVIQILGALIVTAGIAVATYFGALYMTKPHQRILSQVFFVISAIALSMYFCLSPRLEPIPM
jgi:drug/metabolite transporter (DMT)-like permease